MKRLATIRRMVNHGSFSSEEKVTMKFSLTFIKKLKKDAIKTNYDGSIEMENGDHITFHKD